MCPWSWMRFYLWFRKEVKSQLINWWLTIDSMKIERKHGWRSLVPHYLRAKPSTRFCMFSKVQSANYTPCDTPVYLNVYDLTAINGYVYWAGLGVFHSGLEGLCIVLYWFFFSRLKLNSFNWCNFEACSWRCRVCFRSPWTCSKRSLWDWTPAMPWLQVPKINLYGVNLHGSLPS